MIDDLLNKEDFKTGDLKTRLENALIGRHAKANHPITVFNPNETFTIEQVDFEFRNEEIVVKVRGKETCWFGKNMWRLLEDV